MPAPARSLLFALIAAAALGCQQNRPKPVPLEVATNTFNAQLANHCPAKNLQNLPAEQFSEWAKDYRNDADTQSQQLIDLDTDKACSASNSRPECYKAGFIQAEIQMGGLDDIVKQTCNRH